MDLYNLDRARQVVASKGLDAVIVTDPGTITWLSGVVPFDVSGPNPFAGGPAIAWLGPDELILISSGAKRHVTSENGLTHWFYPGYTVDVPMNPSHALAERFLELVETHSDKTDTIGVELEHFPAALYRVLVQTRAADAIRTADNIFTALRAIKTDAEIQKIRGALSLCDLAQQTLIEKAQPGITELELFGSIYGRLVPHAGGAFPVSAALVGGVRTGARLPGPTNYVLGEGDPVLFDIALNYEGYWGDNCNTMVLGRANAPLEKIHGVVWDALSYAKEMIAPGIRASEIDARVRTVIRSAGFEPYPHHTGHGLGVTYHEAPRIVPYNHEPLVKGMVICLEPGIYVPGVGGVRLEDVVLVTDDGCEVLSRGGRSLMRKDSN